MLIEHRPEHLRQRFCQDQPSPVLGFSFVLSKAPAPGWDGRVSVQARPAAPDAGRAMISDGGITPAQPRLGDCNARRAAGSLLLQLSRRRFAHRGRAGNIFLQPSRPVHEPLHLVRSIHRTCSAGWNSHCLRIVWVVRWSACFSNAYFDWVALLIHCTAN